MYHSFRFAKIHGFHLLPILQRHFPSSTPFQEGTLHYLLKNLRTMKFTQSPMSCHGKIIPAVNHLMILGVNMLTFSIHIIKQRIDNQALAIKTDFLQCSFLLLCFNCYFLEPASGQTKVRLAE